jgi:V/A-type H+-transporting ATPase subunit I
MIRRMAKVQIMGPRSRLPGVLAALQHLGVLHFAEPPQVEAMHRGSLKPEDERRRQWLVDRLGEIEAIVGRLGLGAEDETGSSANSGGRAGDLRFLPRLHRLVEVSEQRASELARERRNIVRYRDLFEVFREVLASEPEWPNAAAFHVVLHAQETESLDRLRAALVAEIGHQFVLRWRRLPDDEVAVLILAPAGLRERIDTLLAAARFEEIALPTEFAADNLAAALPAMMRRLREIERQAARLARRRRRLVAHYGHRVTVARRAIHDELARLEAVGSSAVTAHAFVLEGWVDAAAYSRFSRQLRARVGDEVVVRELARENWRAEEAPVILSNPRLFRPFELIVRMLPLPRYGSIDPTPFVAVFFPMFFGLILGDVGYGALLAGLALALRRKSAPESVRRAVSEILGACSLFTLIFGLLYGELFGDLGQRWLHLRPLLFSREEAVLPFLGLALALGLVHVLLGLGLGVVTAFHKDRRRGLGKSVAALMVILIILALLAVVDVLPRGLFAPVVIGLLIAFPVLIMIEGLIAPVELLATVGNVLSYARVMALGTASVMLAVVANRMAGALGSVAVGVIFALLFHLVNFALGIFSPTIHALRLHYVEFFGKFYSPGGVKYQPFRSWAPEQDRNS